MKKLLLTLTLSLIAGSILLAQIAYSPIVDSLKNEITEPTLTTMLEQLSGEVEVSIGGQAYTIVTRHSYTASNAKAAEWIYEQFEAMGLQVEYHYFNNNGENVVATITGTEFPDQQYIICAHYDDMPPGNFAPGADDNASGVIGVLETARLLKDLDLKYTVKFIAFDEEEQGLIGSNAYANEAAIAGDDILGVLNLDMIAYDSDNDYELSIATESGSTGFTSEYTSILGLYDFDLNYNFISTEASDHAPFWDEGYQAILVIEDFNDFNDAYHTTGDVISNCNIPYFKQMAQSAFATIASLSLDMKMELLHDPIASGNSTADREAWLVINSNYPTGNGDASPRLYYSVNGSNFTPIQPYTTSMDTFFFLIPGQVMGSTVEYYLAAQDEDASLVATLPSGGKGFGPPGSVAPESFFSYMVDDIYVLSDCSQSTPKPIQDYTNLYDTIMVDHSGSLVDINVSLDLTHTWVADLKIYLIGPDGTQIDLCIGHGGDGNNFTGTVFDDDATTPISAGSAPFTGTFKPDQPLSTYAGIEMQGSWILRIYDQGSGDIGNLLDWCVDILFSGDPVGIPAQQNNLLTVHQNYPNPFSENTTFSFELDKSGNISIDVIDVLGREIATVTEQFYHAGSHKVQWNAGDLKAGQYFYKVQTDELVKVKPMLIIK